MKTFETFLPVFKGTYGNYWDDYTPCDEYGNELPFERYEINSKDMLESIGKSIIDYLYYSTELFEIAGIESIEFQSSYSPTFYNFTNDSINVAITINSHSKLPEYIYNNYEYFKEEIRRHHTSRDGFWSTTSNDIEEWRQETNGFTNFEDNEYYLGFLLNVICKIEGYEEEDAYYYWCEIVNEYDFCEIKDLTWETVDLDGIFRDNLSKIDFEYGDTIFIKNQAEGRANIFGTDWIDEIDDQDKINLLEGLGLTPEQFEYVTQ